MLLKGFSHCAFVGACQRITVAAALVVGFAASAVIVAVCREDGLQADYAAPFSNHVTGHAVGHLSLQRATTQNVGHWNLGFLPFAGLEIKGSRALRKLKSNRFPPELGPSAPSGTAGSPVAGNAGAMFKTSLDYDVHLFIHVRMYASNFGGLELRFYRLWTFSLPVNAWGLYRCKPPQPNFSGSTIPETSHPELSEWSPL